MLDLAAIKVERKVDVCVEDANVKRSFAHGCMVDVVVVGHVWCGNAI